MDTTPGAAPPPALLRNVLGWSALGAVALAFIAASVVVRPRQLAPALKRGLRGVFRVFGLRIRVVGAERLDPARTCVYMFNHTNVFDHLIVFAHLGGYFVGLEAAEAQRIPIYGWAARRWGQIPIERDSPEAARQACALVSRRLAEGVNVAICPEGRHTRDGRLGPFKKGGFHIAIESRATIVPIALIGLHRLMPHPRLRVAAGPVELRVCTPLLPPPPGPAAHEQLLTQARDEIERELAG